mgnify:CR=1 FL=1
MATPAVGGVAPRLMPSAQGLPAYAELHCRSNFTFLTGASHPEELVARAHELGYTALAITDECSLAGVVRAHGQAKRLGLHLIVGAEMTAGAEHCGRMQRAAAGAAGAVASRLRQPSAVDHGGTPSRWQGLLHRAGQRCRGPRAACALPGRPARLL